MSPTYADELVLITDADLNDAEVRNAELLHIARQTVGPEARKVVGGILVKLKGEQTFASILAESGLADRGWATVIYAIHAGEAICIPSPEQA
ncbi:hypothetical protein [Paracoccus aminovorans]|uniref:hypothetical protein n=1 Tax=Paracoccus aminovorans TaxID=34004 RepID=UPI002B25A3EE|nr:hypothetical protein [Paracoccus aminovorans]